MALEIKQSVRLSQQLVVTPQLQQAIKLLQLSRIELADLIQNEMVENPCLEEASEVEEKTEQESNAELHEQAKNEDRGHEHEMDEVGTKDGPMKEPDNFDWENYVGSYNSPGYSGEREVNGSDETPTYENVVRQSETLQDHLLWQLHLGSFTDDEKQMGSLIIGNITDDGYLTASTEEIAKKLSFPFEMVEKLLQRVQSFDPLGVAARDLTECLLLQIAHLGEDAEPLALLIREHLSLLERHDYPKISKLTGFSIEQVQHLAHIISELEPKPGRPYNSEAPQYITPDVYVTKVGEDYFIALNEDGLPRLQISPLYRRSLMKGTNVAGQTKEYIQERLRAAMWLIKSIHQRQRTLYRVSKSIVKFQRKFFDEGVNALRPLVLKDVAEDVEMHESTISRVTTNKYMHTPRGIFELKYFFNSGVQQFEGAGIASEAVKSRIQKIIDEENVLKPYSDQDIADQLKKFNIDIARRTVAKYREMMGVLPSSRRRRRSV